MKRSSKYGWFALIEGVLLIALGMYTLAKPDQALRDFIILYGAVATIVGIADIILLVRVERFSGFGPIVSLITGTLSVMAGVMLLAHPDAGKWVLSLLFPLWFLAHCISRLAGIHIVRLVAGKWRYWFSLVLNVLGLVLGVMMLVRPWLSLLSLQYIVSIYLVLLGVDCILLACSKIGFHR